MKNFKTRWAFISPYLKKYKLVITIGVCFVVISTALDQVSPWMIKSVIERYSCYETLKRSTNNQELTISSACREIEKELSNSSLSIASVPAVIWTPLLIILITTVLSGVLLFFQRWLVICASRKLEYEVRNDLFVRLQNQPKSFMDKHEVGDLMSHATNDLDRIRDFLGPVVLHVARMPFTLIFTLTAVFILSPKLALIGIIPVFILPLFVNRFLRKMHQLYGKIQKNLGNLNSYIQDAVSGIQVIKSYAKEKTFLAKFEIQSRNLKDTSVKVVLLTSAMWPLIGFLSSFGILCVIWIGARMTQNQEISLGVLMAVLLYLIKLQFPLAGLGWIANLWQRSNASMDRLTDLYSKFEDQQQAPSLPQSHKAPIKFESLELSHLNFRYHEGSDVLKGINLKIKAGQSLGIVGPTGSGKTTLMHLICGIYQPTDGQLLLNENNWSNYTTSDWKSIFSITPQDGFLFSKSIKENIELGSLEAASDKDVKAVGDYSGFSKDLPQIEGGYNALLGERGINLSGGQRQRVGLARAMIHNSEVFCLDDTLSALDTETETYVIHQMREQFKGKTSIIIAHRYSAIAKCDHIIYLEGGEIVEQGTHQQLVKLNGRYAEVFEKQKLSEELEKA